MHQPVEGDPELDEEIEPQAFFFFEQYEDGSITQTNMTEEQVVEIFTMFFLQGKTIH